MASYSFKLTSPPLMHTHLIQTQRTLLLALPLTSQLCSPLIPAAEMHGKEGTHSDNLRTISPT